jgi:hypothetical protein
MRPSSACFTWQMKKVSLFTLYLLIDLMINEAEEGSDAVIAKTAASANLKKHQLY